MSDPNPALRARPREHRLGEFFVCDFALPPGYRMDEHEHDRPGLVVPLAGAWRGRSTDGEATARGDGIGVVPAGFRHRETTGPEGSRCLLVTVDPDRRPERGIDLDRPGTLARPERVRLGSALRRELRASDPAAPLVAEGLLLELFGAFPGPPADASPAWMGRVVELLRDRFADSFTHDEIAAEAGVSREHLARTFRRIHGQPIGAWVRRIRVQQAARQLRAGEGPIGRIAARCGFADQSHLTRWFRRHYALTPLQYRRRLRGGAGP